MRSLNELIEMNKKQVDRKKVKALKESKGFQRQQYWTMKKRFEEKYGESI